MLLEIIGRQSSSSLDHQSYAWSRRKNEKSNTLRWQVGVHSSGLLASTSSVPLLVARRLRKGPEPECESQPD